jgi:hypothetical protein
MTEKAILYIRGGEATSQEEVKMEAPKRLKKPTTKPVLATSRETRSAKKAREAEEAEEEGAVKGRRKA